MFGLSPTKILFTILIVVVVWYGFKWLGRAQLEQKKHARQNKEAQKSKSRDPQADETVEDLVECSKCGDFVVSDKKNGCGREGCPYDR